MKQFIEYSKWFYKTSMEYMEGYSKWYIYARMPIAYIKFMLYQYQIIK